MELRVSYVYIIINKVTGDAYVGKANDPQKRWKRHQTHKSEKKHLSRAFKKYGLDSFEFSVVEEWPSECEAYEAETWLISYLRSIGATLYNENDGGFGQSKGKTWTLSEESRANQRIAAKKRPPPTKAQKEAISKTLMGRSISKEQSQKRKESPKVKSINKGRKHTDEARQNMKESHIGSSLTEEHRQNISEGGKRRWKRWREEQETKTKENHQ